MPALLIYMLFFFFFFFPHLVLAVQQSYPSSEYTMDCTKYHPDNEGYMCEPETPKCETLAYFHVQDGPFSTLDSIASQLFSTIPSSIAQASTLSSDDDQALLPDEGLYIPFTCGCSGSFTSHNVTYTIRPGDTLAQVANLTYEGLTTCQAIQNANPNHSPTDLHVGDQLVFPLRCACPNAEQKLRGITMLVTYPVGGYRNESVSSVTSMFGITPQEFLVANNITNISQSLFPAITVLLPFLERPTIPPNASYMRIPPPMTSIAPLAASLDGGQHRRGHITIAIAIPVGLSLLALIIIAASCFARKVKCRSPSNRKALQSSESGKPIFPSKNEKLEKDLFEGMSDFATYEKLSNYSVDDIKQATQNFSPATVIKGAVYRGTIKGKVVAIKGMTRDVSKELQILRKVNHMNLVSLLGFCIESPEQAYLVYEFAENGSLHDWLHGHGFSTGSTGSSCTLTFGYRLQIALDVATAMEYIHDHTYPGYVHKDINSQNILLDARMRAKIANFALAKPMEDMEPETRHIVGTQGYMAPEYVTNGQVSTKVDVYAFGVVLLEMLSGEEAIVREGKVGKERCLAEAIGPLLSGPDARERLKQWMDPSFNNVFPLDCAYSLAILARSCVAEDPSARPNAREVAFTLSKLLEACLEWEPSGVLEVFTHKPNIEAR